MTCQIWRKPKAHTGPAHPQPRPPLTLSHPTSTTDGEGASRRCEAVCAAPPTLFTPRTLVNTNKRCDSLSAATIFTPGSRMTSLLHFHMNHLHSAGSRVDLHFNMFPVQRLHNRADYYMGVGLGLNVHSEASSARLLNATTVPRVSLAG